MDPLTVFLAVNGIYGQAMVVRKRARGFGQLIAGQVVWLIWEGLHFSLAGPLMIGTVSYLVTYVWGWRSWRRSPEKTEKEVPVKPRLRRAAEIAISADLVEYGLMVLVLAAPLSLALAGSVAAGRTGMVAGLLLGTAAAIWGAFQVPVWTERAAAWKEAQR